MPEGADGADIAMIPDPSHIAPLGRILIVGNYEPEKQESMLRFASLLKRQMEAQGFEVSIIQPKAISLRLAGAAAHPLRGMGKWLGYLDKFVLFPLRLGRVVRQYDLVHICDHSNAMYGRWTKGKPWMLTCNDMLAVRSALGEFSPLNSVRWSGRVLQQWIAKWIARAPRVACISSATREDVLRITAQTPPNVEVIHMGLNYPYQPRTEADWRPVVAELFVRNGLAPNIPHVVHIGGNQWYKNRMGVVRLFALAASERPDLHLVMAGKAPNDELLEEISRLGIGERVHFVGAVSNPELEALYHSAECLVFPSLAEGFGWPVIEAQSCGCRVAASNCPPLPEVGGSSCLYLDLTDLTIAARQFLDMLRESPSEKALRVREGLINVRQFDPAIMGRRYLELYQSILTNARGAK